MPKRVAQSDPHGAESLVMQIFLGGLICWRLMLPVESSIQGETLWVAQATLAAVVVWACLQLFRRREFVRFDRWDALVWLTIAGHAISTAWIWKWGGDKRAGLNLCWEWISLGALFFLLRQSIRTRQQAGKFIQLLIAIAVCFACFGFWQKYYAHDQLVQEYLELRDRYDELQSESEAGLLTNERAAELNKIEIEFSQSNVPLDGPGRIMFQSRLEYSSEPTARWALANSLGGFLAVGLVLCSIFLGTTSHNRRQLIWMVPTIAVLGWTLWLTNSRTAGVGLTIAILGIVIDRLNVTPDRRRSLLKGSMAIAVLSAFLVGGFLVSIDAKSLDEHIVTRTLKTRIQYWIASTAMLAEHPVFGVGPGNFRQHYLVYKLPESSEEIQDPHNFVLDLWSSGGVIALLPWLGILSLIARELFRVTHSSEDDPSPKESKQQSAMPGSSVEDSSSGTLLGAGLVLLGLFLYSVLRDREIAWELLAFAVAIPTICRILPSRRFSDRTLKSACWWGIVAMSIHLLGAGGIEMPGIVSIFLILLAIAVRSDSVADGTPAQQEMWIFIGIGASAVALSWGCYQFATSPVHTSKSLSEEAYYQLSESGDVADARRFFREAANQDRWAAEPWRQLAELEWSIWRQNPQENSTFERIRDATEQAKVRDPWSGRDARFLGEVYRTRYELLRQREWGERAIEELEIANLRIPHHERILLQIALLADSLNFPEKAVDAAKKAIEIDRLSRKNGHWEKLLSEEELSDLAHILDSD